jgi:hypothetical protein
MAPPAVAGEKTFQPPTYQGHRVDVCAHWGKDCGESAATQFCQKQGFDKAKSWTIAKGIGAQAPTLVIGDHKICDQPTCDGFAAITCTKSGSSLGRTQPTGSRGSSGPASEDALNMAEPPKPGPSQRIKFDLPGSSLNFYVFMSNIDINQDGFYLDITKAPSIELRFAAAPRTAYIAECSSFAQHAPYSLGYTLEWTSSLKTEKTPGPQVTDLKPDGKNVDWISAAIPIQNSARNITVRASGFTSSRWLLECQLTPYKAGAVRRN